MLEGFVYHRIPVAAGDAEINVAAGGSGRPLLLLHGFPQTHLAWHAVAGRLADRYSLVLPDLRGYGDSRGPRPDGGAPHLQQAGDGRRHGRGDGGAGPQPLLSRRP